MRPEIRRHQIKLRDGEVIEASVSEAHDRVIASGADVTRKLLYDRIYLYTRDHEGPVPWVVLASPLNSKVSLGMKGYIRPSGALFDGVEGFDRPVSAADVWIAFVGDENKTLPTSRTVRRRLDMGYRTKAELSVAAYSTGRKPVKTSEEGKRRNRMKITQKMKLKNRENRKKQEMDNWIARMEKAEKPVKKIPNVENRPNRDIPLCKPLPPIETWSGWDSGYYRRGE